ncbi:NAD-dependent epimerase/dehydratase [Oleidesulfovibrio alaskensis G20]|uniref:NAD-dependent epimerase/dehydratase n=1 Tax=Oleidesulfovibrio alaskensis (strain ATCC BAA-1058 / DSM 17464 / G20) TaxID=207559 RepID=Q316V9_OLEA2|nr:SDR family oxidoreductase [Oleidesulfovibrio alaskensis]ABB37037.1 NAD-dependent epimerase/dehydratase [Oleidesulfovibrio alaskensis G20]MBG0773017.1 SDR family oxidoreductase [Oleidesulfovibrio alaskensis]
MDNSETASAGRAAAHGPGTVLVLGASGYVGGRLVPLLLEKGWHVRAAGRSAEKLRCRPWAAHPACSITEADARDAGSLLQAMRGCEAAYYLVHSMSPGGRGFEGADRQAACAMVEAANASAAESTAADGGAGLRRIIYLSGLVPDDPQLSAHLRSRAEVARILALGRVPVTTLRAAQILGSGSASFEILRYLADRLPVMITPRWVRTQTQPIAVSDVLAYLAGCLEHPETTGRTYDIGGPDILSYTELFALYADVAGLRRRVIIPVPFLSPALSAHWLNVVTPVPRALAAPLVEGLRNRVVCAENSIRDVIPLQLTDCRTAISMALDKVRQHAVATCWTDAGAITRPEWLAEGDAPYAGGTVLQDGYSMRVAASPEAVWEPVRRIGGETGWYYDDWLWRLRGLLDKLAGGVGARRGRRHPVDLRVGDALDFWRVLSVRHAEHLLLLAEMKVPGEAMLEIRVVPVGAQTELRMRAWFLPRGLWGLAYWYLVYPLHGLVFKGMLRALGRKAGADGSAPVRKLPPEDPAACRLPTDGGSAR